MAVKTTQPEAIKISNLQDVFKFAYTTTFQPKDHHNVRVGIRYFETLKFKIFKVKSH